MKQIIIGMLAALAVMLSGCKSWPTTDKSINTGGEVEAAKVESVGGPESGTVLPNVLAGGGAHAYQSSAKFAKGQTCPPMWIKANQSTLLSQFLSIFGFSGTGCVEAYTGVPGESAADTAARLAAFRSTDTTATSWQKLKALFGGSQSSIPAKLDTEQTDTNFHLLGTVSKNGVTLGPCVTSNSHTTGFPTVTGTAELIHDGDTITRFKCTDGSMLNVRLYGIDCPELKQPYGIEAKAKLVSMAQGKTLTVQIVGKDVHPERVDGVVLVDGQNVNLAMVQTGYAWAYPEYLKAADKPAYQSAQDAAQKAKLGLWSDANPTPPWDYRKAQKNKGK